ncbi:MAG: hypothetical protein ABF271_08335 [Abyssibacter sp.]|uniref:hypothetical protein n=1 Tax=Abyssibacter sp. TaxID=2320200 RepID=UPI002ECE50B7|nr:hypothetical protein [Pseudomonadota bacterium]
MLRIQTVIMFLVLVGVCFGTVTTLNVLIDRSVQETRTQGATAEQVFGSTAPAALTSKPEASAQPSSAEAEIRRVARAVALAAAQQVAADVARAEVADQL